MIPTQGRIKSSLGLALCLSWWGCATVEPSRSDGVYQKDLRIREGSQEFRGLGVLPPKTEYRLELRSRKEPEVVRLSNCHRDVVLRDVDDKLAYWFTPNPKVESGSCILQISFLDSKGYHQFGAITFKEEGDELPAAIACNGAEFDTFGASACQAKVGTLQSIEFAEPVEAKSSAGCEKPTSDDEYTWFYSIKEGFCLYLFRSDDGEFHKLTTFGYNDIVKIP